MGRLSPDPASDLLRLVANNLTEMVLAYDMDRKLVFVNRAAETLTGYSVAELQDANFINWIYPDDQGRMLSFWDTLFQGRSFHDEEYRLVTKDGRVKWVTSSWRPILDDAGRQVGVQGREFDITPRKLAEAAHRHSEERLRVGEERYRALFEDSPFPMWEEDFAEVRQFVDSLAARGVTDLRRYFAEHPAALEDCVSRVHVIDVNRAAREFYGASTKAELMASLSQIFDEHALEVFRDEIAALAENHQSYQTEFPVRTLQGEERLVNMIVSIAETARRDWSRVIVSFFDVTDRKRLEEHVLQSQKMESLGRLAGGIAHDFNNLLTVINGYTEWVLGDMAPDDRFRAPLSEVRKAGERCAELTRQLLAFGRKQVVRPAPLDLNAFVRESQSVLDRMLGDDVQLRIDLAPDLGIVEADRGQLHQVLMNLVVNAREAMPRGGVLTVRTRNVENSDQVMLEVRDTGQGIDATVRSRLFEPFFTTKKESNNSGLGLAIVFGIVTAARGRIDVQSQPGEGAAFRIYLPRADAPVAPVKKEARAAQPLRPGKVLVVDDRDDVRDLACRMVEMLGLEPVRAAGGAEALRMVEGLQGPPPLLLTDVVMPGMNGRELAGEMRRLFPGLPVVFMSGYTDQILTDGPQDGLTFYIQKPFTAPDLASVLRRAQEAADQK